MVRENARERRNYTSHLVVQVFVAASRAKCSTGPRGRRTVSGALSTLMNPLPVVRWIADAFTPFSTVTSSHVSWWAIRCEFISTEEAWVSMRRLAKTPIS